MAKVVLIGGNKRAGKTTLAMLLHKKYGFNYINFDSLLDSLEDTFEELNDGNDKKYIDLIDNMIDYSLKESNNYNINIVYDYIFNPQDLNEIRNKNKVDIYFLANLDATKENLLQDFNNYSNEYDWDQTATNNELMNNIDYILNKNKLLIDECEKYNCILINTSRAEERNKILEELAKEIAS